MVVVMRQWHTTAVATRHQIRSPFGYVQSRGHNYCTTIAVTIPNIPSGPSAWLKMWQW